MAVPEGRSVCGSGIPSTYVPARNMIFLSYGVSFAESIKAGKVFIGAHELDFSNYPDCRKEFFETFQEAVFRGTKAGAEGDGVKIETPIIGKTKKEIVRIGASLGVPFEYTWSCYKEGEAPCGVCESCIFRAKAFEEADIKDPLI
jgi:7-cyano-7-deazaguanine synthase